MARVQIDNVDEEWAEMTVPVPPEPDATKLGQCKCYFIQWPKAQLVLEEVPDARASPAIASPAQVPSPLSLSQPRLSFEEGVEAGQNKEVEMDLPEEVVEPPMRTERRSKLNYDLRKAHSEEPANKTLSPATLEKCVSHALADQTPTETQPLVSKRSVEACKIDKKKKHTKRGGSTRKKVSASDSAAKNLGFGSASAQEQYVAGFPLVSPYDYNTLGREAKMLHDIYMKRIADPKTFQAFIPLAVPDEYHFFNEFGMKKFFVDFFDLHPLYNFKRLETNLIRAWTLYQAKEVKRVKASIGLLDPILFQDVQLQGNKESVVGYIAEAWVHHKEKDFIILPYNPP